MTSSSVGTFQGFCLTWDRTDYAPKYCTGATKSPSPGLSSQSDFIWSAGYIANRLELIQTHPAPEGDLDHQLLLQLYRSYGSQAAERIAGPLTWILWDNALCKLLAFRDRIGVYSLYYYLKENSIWLADQLELLLNTCLTTPSINPRSVVAHLNGMSPLPGESFYEGIHSLEPGHYLEINRTTLELRRYWQVEPGQELKLASDEEYASAFRELFFDIVPEHLPGSPTGVTLSSGLDSTSIAAAVKSTVPSQQLTAFCWVTPELPSADESRYIHDVCQKLNLPAIELRADLCWPLSTQEGIRTSRATPFYNYYTELWDEVFRTVQQNEINTLFTGASGDNLFGGNVFAYPDLLLTGHWLELARQIRTHIPRSPNRLNLAQIVRKLILAPIVRTYRPRWTYRRPRPVPWLGENYQDLYQAHFPTLTSTPLLLPGRRQRLEMLRDPRLTRITEWTTKQAASYHIDLRHPLLDHRLMEFAARLPTTQTFRAAQRKIIVRNAMRGYLPDSVLNMWDKIYPTEIFVRGVRERETGKVWSLLTDMRAAQLGFVNPEILRRNYQDYLDGKHQNDRFWHALTLEDWLRRYF